MHFTRYVPQVISRSYILLGKYSPKDSEGTHGRTEGINSSLLFDGPSISAKDNVQIWMFPTYLYKLLQMRLFNNS